PGNRYGEVIVIEEYQGNYCLVLGKKGEKGGTTFKKWCFPEFKKELGKKSVPWRIPLGNRDDACQVAKQIAEAFGWVVQDNSAKTDKKPWTPPPDDNDLPF
ncbi:MAG: hypothetical protein V1690_03775, partial [Candidatus Moraniibacteriota bacterium]